MNRLKGLEINTKVEIDVDDPDHGGKFLSRVMDITDSGIKIMAPTDHGNLVLLRINTPISIIYVGDRALYSFDTVVTGRFNEPIHGLVVKLPKKVERIQRREFVRLEVKLYFKYQILDETKHLRKMDQDPFSEGFIIDISGGGIRFISNHPLNKGTSLKMLLEIDDMEKELIIGKVVRTQKLSTQDEYEIGVAFEALPNFIQDKIISWIFDKQRELRRRGLA